MKNDKYNEILHWLAYNFNGIYRLWCDKEDFKDSIKLQSKKYEEDKK